MSGSLNTSNSIRDLGIDPAVCDVLARNGTTRIGDFAYVTRSELESVGISSAEIEKINIQLEGYGFNNVA